MAVKDGNTTGKTYGKKRDMAMVDRAVEDKVAVDRIDGMDPTLSKPHLVTRKQPAPIQTNLLCSRMQNSSS
jgi:hypothetical protein